MPGPRHNPNAGEMAQSDKAKMEAECKRANEEALERKKREIANARNRPPLEWWEQPGGRENNGEEKNPDAGRPGSARREAVAEEERREVYDEGPLTDGASDNGAGGAPRPRTKSGRRLNYGPEGRSAHDREKLARDHERLLAEDLKARQKVLEAEREAERRDEERVRQAEPPWIGGGSPPKPRAFGRRDAAERQRPATSPRDVSGGRRNRDHHVKAEGAPPNSNGYVSQTAPRRLDDDDDHGSPLKVASPRLGPVARDDIRPPDPSVARHLSAALDAALTENEHLRDDLKHALDELDAYRERHGPLRR